MEGDFLFWLVDCKSHSLVNVFTFSGGWKPVEDANLYSNLSSSQRPFLVTLDITKLLPDSCTSSHPPLKACVPRRATAQRRSQGASPPAEGAEGPRPDASGRREAGGWRVRCSPAAEAAHFREDQYQKCRLSFPYEATRCSVSGNWLAIPRPRPKPPPTARFPPPPGGRPGRRDSGLIQSEGGDRPDPRRLLPRLTPPPPPSGAGAGRPKESGKAGTQAMVF